MLGVGLVFGCWFGVLGLVFGVWGEWKVLPGNYLDQTTQHIMFNKYTTYYVQLALSFILYFSPGPPVIFFNRPLKNTGVFESPVKFV